MDGIPALDPWDLVVEASHVPSNQPKTRSNLLSDKHGEKHYNAKTKKQFNKTENLGWTNVATSLHAKLSRFGALLCIFEDKDAVIKMIEKVRSPTMSHVTRTFRVALDRSFNRINLDLVILIKCIDIKHQLADMLTKGNVARDEWKHLLRLVNIMSFSNFSCSHLSKLTDPRSCRRG